MRAFLNLKIPPLLLLVFFLFLQAVTVPRVLERSGWQWWAACAVLVVSGVLALAAVKAFRRVHTTVDPRQPQSSSTLLTEGVYAWTRNPMYLAFAGVLLAQTIYLGWPVGVLWVVVFVVYLTEWQIKPEEAALIERFGEVYCAYLKKVRRWF